jgi:hypothetical protein
MPDRFCSYICFSKHAGSRVSVSDMDIPDIKGADAVWHTGDRIYGRLAIEIAER